MPPLEPIDDDIWLVDGSNVSFFGFPYSTRSVIVRLPGGELWVWSPIEASANLFSAIDDLGSVAHLVSPNKIHHLFLQQWKDRYPGAAIWGPESTIAKRRDLTFEPALEDTPPPPWAECIDQAWVRGSAAMDEVVFFHRPSRTIILADLSENFSDDFLRRYWSPWKRVIARVWKIERGFAPLEWRLSFLDRAHARVALRKMLDWDPLRVVMAHGEWQRDGGRAYLERVFSWLG